MYIAVNNLFAFSVTNFEFVASELSIGDVDVFGEIDFFLICKKVRVFFTGCF